MYVRAGDRLFSVVPPGQLRGVGNFVPADALGRVRPGQTARLRLEGFPWTQYGTVPATVTHVGSELRDGKVRVEFAIHPDPGSAIPMQHGLPAMAEVDVEQVSPATLVLRSIGGALGRPTAVPAEASK
jgi:membrane fusion protein (multidrug efflux system)